MSNIHYGLNEKEKSGGGGEAYDDSSLKADLATLKSDLTAEKLKVSLNKTNISVNAAAVANTNSTLAATRSSLNTTNLQVTMVSNTANSNVVKIATEKARITTNTSAIATNTSAIADNKTKVDRNTRTSVDANSRSKENKQSITTLEAKAETNRLGILNTFTSINTYHLYTPDLSNTYKTMHNFPNVHWPAHLIQFGSIDTKTTFRLVGISMDDDATVPTSNFSMSFMMRAYTTTGGSLDAVLWTLNMSNYQIQGKQWFCINEDVTLRSKFPTGNYKCGQLYIKHNHGAAVYTVESIVTFMVVQF